MADAIVGSSVAPKPAQTGPVRPRAAAQSGTPSAFAENLRHLCSLQRSTSEVCRSIGINRQQFNKYLSGAAAPSSFNLARISAYFGLAADELRRPGLAAGQMTLPLMPKPAVPVYRVLEAAMAVLTESSNVSLRSYVGFYFRYNYAFDGSGRIVRGLFRISEQDGLFLTRLVERLQHRSNKSTELTTLKYDGVLFALSGCLFNVEYERLMRSCVGHAAFPRIMRPGQRFLAGLQSSFSSSTGRPAASRVVLERVPPGMGLRAMLRRCGTFHRREGGIEPDVLELIDNRVAGEADIFCPPGV